ncbi:MAG: hypothetical protein MHM6MM_008876 [Cercozoa sp. M6MM]
MFLSAVTSAKIEALASSQTRRDRDAYKSVSQLRRLLHALRVYVLDKQLQTACPQHK